MINSDQNMAQIMNTRQKAFNLSSEDDVGNVLQKSVDLLRALITSYANPEKLNLAVSTLEQERLLVRESEMKGAFRLRNLIYQTSETMETTMAWISNRESVRPRVALMQESITAACPAQIPDENNNITPTIKIECDIKIEEPDTDDDLFAVSEVGTARSTMKEARFRSKNIEVPDMKLELCDLSDNENEAKIEKLQNVKSELALEKESIFKRKKRECLSKEDYASLTAEEMMERKRRLGLANTLRLRAKLLASGPVDCDICGETQTSKEALKYHVRTRHINVGRYKCSTCPKAFPSSSVLKRHELTHLPLDDPRRNNKDAFCKICNRQFKSNYIYKDHMRVHEKDESVKKPHKCDQCEKAFTHIFNLNKHKRSHTNDETIKKPHKCNFCERRFALGWSLRDHERIHLPDDDPRKKGVECKTCGKEMSSMTKLRYHKLTHKGSERKRFNCDQCDQTFATSISLKWHKNSHTGNFPLRCELCGKGYNTNQQMRVHMRSHSTGPIDKTAKRNKLCDLCPRRFAKEGDLTAHMKRHRDGTLNPSSEEEDSDVEVFQCKICNKKFLNRKTMVYHTRIKHGEKSVAQTETEELKDDKSSEVEEDDDEEEDSEVDSEEESSDNEEDEEEQASTGKIR